MRSTLLSLLICGCLSEKGTPSSTPGGLQTSSPSESTLLPTPPDPGTPSAPVPALPEEARAAIEDAIEADLALNLASGASIAIALQGEIVYAAGFGTRHPERDE